MLRNFPDAVPTMIYDHKMGKQSPLPEQSCIIDFHSGEKNGLKERKELTKSLPNQVEGAHCLLVEEKFKKLLDELVEGLKSGEGAGSREKLEKAFGELEYDRKPRPYLGAGLLESGVDEGACLVVVSVIDIRRKYAQRSRCMVITRF